MTPPSPVASGPAIAPSPAEVLAAVEPSPLASGPPPRAVLPPPPHPEPTTASEELAAPSPAATRAPTRPIRASAPRAAAPGRPVAADSARRRAADPCRSAALADDDGKSCFDHIDTTLRTKALEPGHPLWKRYSDLWLRRQYPQTPQEQAASMTALRALAREVDRLP